MLHQLLVHPISFQYYSTAEAGEEGQFPALFNYRLSQYGVVMSSYSQLEISFALKPEHLMSVSWHSDVP